MSCDSAYRYQWWLVVFNAAAQIGVVLSIITDTLEKHRIGICSVLAVLTVMLMDNANEFVTVHDKASGALADRATVFIAGCVLAAMMHIILIFAFGRTNAPAATQGPPTNGTYKTYENQMAERPVQEQHLASPPPSSYPPV
ncbi:hypothetical protein COCSUDRAFT_63486 [Coccomyxa subellipsoidea C-169]|uniref:Uncharacterized protein n=1 Tax=Coccomyxa subellipsoidea (strain C-169) TaxID=574566 RepID=I0YXJ7_COCSC|nr:hypothetical protein COCSUDRAFT_63486 [Coccomyxa subellipsoidea C-169]EIE23116.1 hypothetical protein COCSUDRAFT_63486 [Coccomyxa subellipsoidea C-169]|eukprot:XP_005647660.1 hypothetical protein COCSUDRAFT_63486 [Coccomyxa subellipsoidea C-169]